MLNMTIEQFKEKLDEIINLRKQILEKQDVIQCNADGTNILLYETDILLTFANREGISVNVQYNEKEDDEICRCRYLLYYRGVQLVGYSTGRSYQLYREGGLIS